MGRYKIGTLIHKNHYRRLALRIFPSIVTDLIRLKNLLQDVPKTVPRLREMVRRLREMANTTYDEAGSDYVAISYVGA